jgi:ABC-type uncharacterized transport system permease subunit
VQSQIFLGKYSPEQTGMNVMILVLWIIGLSVCFRYLWQKGIREYGAMGH